jgi:hypothetical protein
LQCDSVTGCNVGNKRAAANAAMIVAAINLRHVLGGIFIPAS